MAEIQPGSAYDVGFEAGLVQGYRAARDGDAAFAAYAKQMDRRRKFLAWSTLILGVGGALGAVVAMKDRELFVVFTVAGGVITALVGAAAIMGDDSAPGAFGIRAK